MYVCVCVCVFQRAGGQDLEQDNADKDVLITCPILSLWGRDFDLVGQMFDVLAVWKTMGTNVTGCAIPEAGHLPQEEQPERVNLEILSFLQGWDGKQNISIQLHYCQ